MAYKNMKIFTFKDHLKKSLKDSAFRKVWKDSEAEYVLACKVIEARLKRRMSQRDLAKKIGTSQAAISRIEAMNGNPSFTLLKRIAAAFDTKLQISLS